MAAGATHPTRRRRPKHDPRDSEREILQAAERLIRERPLREVTVAAIMAQTGLQRPAFWAHFRDLNEVVIRIAEQITEELVTASSQWLGSGPTSAADLLEGLRRSGVVYAEHSAVLRALADAAPSDARVEAAYYGIVENLADAVARRIEGEQSAGAIAAELGARETARALIWMNERYLYRAMAHEPQPDIATVTGVLGQIWLATLYGRGAEAGPAARR